MKYTLFIALFLSHLYLGAQQITRNGVVKDKQTLETLPGVIVQTKDGSSKAATNENGEFSLVVSSQNPVLVFSSVGHKTTEVQVTSQHQEILLEPDVQALEEVIVVAYGTTEKASYTGSAAVVSSKQIASQQISSVSNSLQGLVPGLQSVAPAGQPGSNANLRLRGIGSINASSDPLYVVDGAPFPGNINAINPSDIASVTVLKDAAASALYGSRGANGVIIITTKQGSYNSPTQLTAGFTSGFSTRAIEDYHTLNTSQYFELQWEALRNTQLDQGKSPEAAAEYASRELTNTLKINPFGPNYPQPVGLNGKLVNGAVPLWKDDWGKSITRTGVRHQADLSLSGGSEKTSFFISASYLQDEGFIIGSDFNRLSTRLNYRSEIKPWLRTNIHVSTANTKSQAPPQSDSSTGNYANIGRLISNIYPLYQRNPDGSYLLDEQGKRQYDFGNYRPSTASAGTNLLGQAYLNSYENKHDQLSLRGSVDIDLIPGLVLKSSINADYNNAMNHNYINPEFGSGIASKGSVSKSAFRDLSYTLNNLLDYRLTLAQDHQLSFLAGHELYSFDRSDLSGGRSNFGFSGKKEPEAASLITSFTGSSDRYKLVSYLGKVDYNFQRKYYLSASFRRDGSSRFSADSRWGNFWSVGGSWNAKKESFFESVQWLDRLTFRGSYGAQGNDNLGEYYAYQDLYAIYNSLNEAGLISSRLPTPKLKWESNLNLNLGIDFSIAQERFSGSLEYYTRKSKDLLFSRPLAPSLGFVDIAENIGSLKNTGVEAQFQVSAIQKESFQWRILANVGHFVNKITELPQKEIISGNVGQLGATKRLTVGSSVYDFYIREWAGIDPENGNPLWYKNTYDPAQPNLVNGRTTTSIYADADKYDMGSSLPDVYGGLTNTFTYKNFELSALITYSIGGKILDLDKVMLSHNGENFGRTWSKDMIHRWTPENTQTDIPRLGTVTTNWNGISSRFLYDASYARLRNVSLSYLFSNQISQKIGVTNLRLQASGQNLLTWFGPQGLDPEQALDGVTFYRYPAQKTFTIGIQASL